MSLDAIFKTVFFLSKEEEECSSSCYHYICEFLFFVKFILEKKEITSICIHAAVNEAAISVGVFHLRAKPNRVAIKIN